MQIAGKRGSRANLFPCNQWLLGMGPIDRWVGYTGQLVVQYPVYIVV